MTRSSLALGLALFGLMLCSCAHSESQRNPSSGAHHSLVKHLHPQEWPAAGVDPERPRGLLFPAHGEARATLLCLHGIQTHAGWFGPLAERLTAEGFNVIAMDRRGSGMNTTKPFVKGYARDADELLADLQAQLTSAHALGVPVYLVATSWSSNLAAVYALRDVKPRPAGIVQLVPATRSRFESKPGAWLVEAGNGLAPRCTFPVPFKPIHYQAGAVQPAHPDRPLKKPHHGEVERVDARLAALLEADAASGVLLEKPSFRLLKVGLTLASEWRDAPETSRTDIPFMVVVADSDQIMDNASALAVARQHATDVTVRTLAKAGHGAQITHVSEIAEALHAWTAHRRR